MRLSSLPPFGWPRPAARYGLILALIALCCAVELVLLASDFGLIGTVRWRMFWLQNGAFWSGLMRDWQPNYAAQPWLMYGTYAALHTGPAHLLGNMLALIWLGPWLIDRLGNLRFAVLWLTAAFGGAACFAALSTTPAPMVGASGAVFGLLGAVVALDYLRTGEFWPVMSMTGALAVLNLATFALERGALAWETHLGGYLTGILVIAALNPDQAPRD